jgi:predicted short-subunit dehydrogenase-like oxidoreductase (DUF2520 family)
MDPWTEALAAAEVILLAVPDDAITAVAARIREAPLARTTVLHCSGLRDRSALAPLQDAAAGLGSFHPLQTLAGDREAAERLRAAYAVLEGDPTALAMGRRLAQVLGMEAIELEAASKPAYHAAAVIASNYSVTLADVAAAVARAAGVPPEAAARIFLPLMAGTVTNLLDFGPTGALTGPIRRGDVGTVQAHLRALDPDDRQLYVLLGLRTIRVARAAGLQQATADALERVLLEAWSGGLAPTAR